MLFSKVGFYFRNASILPVQVKSKNGHETVGTCAFLDPGS